MNVCLSHSLKQFKPSSLAKVVLISIIKVGLDTLPNRDNRHHTNVANCHNRDGNHGKAWSKQDYQKFLEFGGGLHFYSNANIEQSHGDKNYAKDDESPYGVAVVDEGFAVVDIRANVVQEQPKVWLIERIKRRKNGDFSNKNSPNMRILNLTNINSLPEEEEVEEAEEFGTKTINDNNINNIFDIKVFSTEHNNTICAARCD